MTTTRILFSNGVISNSSNTPPISTFLQTHPGAYTTTRTHNNGSCLMFWDRHLQRLANSARILFNSHPQLLFTSSHDTIPSLAQPLSSPSKWESMVKSLVNNSMNKVMPIALKERRDEEELSVTVLFCGDFDKLSGMENVGFENICNVFDVHVHLSGYVPPLFGFHGSGACLAVVGRGRDVGEAKYADWVRLRKSLEKLRPPTVTELLLSNDGDQILEGSVTNFFVVCRKVMDRGICLFQVIDKICLHEHQVGQSEAEDNCLQSIHASEVQTAPISDGALPGVIRQLVIEVCLNKGIPIREVSPSWSKHELWEEAFITSSLRILQHVESIQVPITWGLHESKGWEDIAWKEKRFEESPGTVTQLIQKEIMERAGLERNI